MWRLAIRILHPYSRVPAMICSAHLSRLVPSNFQYLRGEADLLAGAFARFMEQKWPAGAWRHRRDERSFQQLGNLRGINPIALEDGTYQPQAPAPTQLNSCISPESGNQTRLKNLCHANFVSLAGTWPWSGALFLVVFLARVITLVHRVKEGKADSGIYAQ